jgi:hypothetical protein
METPPTSLLAPLGGSGYLKAGFLGFEKSGKTWTAMLLAIGVRKHFELEGPIAMFDTETGSSYVAPMVKALSGTELIGRRSRDVEDLIRVVDECVERKVSVLVVDSVTHLWESLKDAYLAELFAKQKKRPHGLAFQDWGPIKAKWARWTNAYLNSPLHIIICGRAGYIWDFEENAEGKKELVKTGVKMKTEGEFGFEPSLLVQMERLAGEDGKLLHHATILGDRFGVIDGKEADNPQYEFFAPHVKRLSRGEHAPVNTATSVHFGIDGDGEAEWKRERRDRTILSEEIQGDISRAFPGQTTKEKQAKLELLQKHFGTTSWTQISENTKASVLRVGLSALRADLGIAPPMDELPAWAGGEET